AARPRLRPARPAASSRRAFPTGPAPIDAHDTPAKSGRRLIIRHDHLDAATSARKGQNPENCESRETQWLAAKISWILAIVFTAFLLVGYFMMHGDWRPLVPGILGTGSVTFNAVVLTLTSKRK